MKQDLFELLDIAKHAASLAADVHRQAIQQNAIRICWFAA